MTAPSYTEDLTDIDDAGSDANWEECNATGWDTGGASATDSDYPYIQTDSGNGAVSQQATKAAIGGLMCDNGSGITLPTDGAYFVWQFFASSTGLDTYANGGLRVVVGSDRDNFKSWDVGGSDKAPYPLGGWVNHAVNTGVSVDDTVGSPTSTERYIGAAYKSLVAIGKGNPHAVDVLRYGRGSSIFEYGDGSNGYCTFAGFAAADETSSVRWGLVISVAGSYLWKGKMTLGTTSNLVDFRDSNVSVLWDDTPKVTSNFNTIEINNASSNIEWTNVSFKALGTTSPGRLVMNHNATLDWDGCQFEGMGVFGFGGTNSSCTNAQWRSCGQITINGATLAGSSVSGYEGTAGTAATVWDTNSDPNGELDNMTFTKGTAATHAIEFGSNTPSSVTVTGWTTSGYNASNGNNDSTFYNNTGGSLTINVIGGTGNFSYRNGSGASTTIVVSPITITITVKDINTQGVLQNARVLLVASSSAGDLPYQESVTEITRSGSTATVSHTGHGMATGDFALISGANQNEYNGCWEITYISDNSYSYTVPGTPATPATGTIIATGGVFNTLTNASGVVTDSRSITNDQPFTGRVRLSTGSTLYKTAPIADTIDNADGYSATVYLIPDG